MVDVLKCDRWYISDFFAGLELFHVFSAVLSDLNVHLVRVRRFFSNFNARWKHVRQFSTNRLRFSLSTVQLSNWYVCDVVTVQLIRLWRYAGGFDSLIAFLAVQLTIFNVFRRRLVDVPQERHGGLGRRQRHHASAPMCPFGHFRSTAVASWRIKAFS